MIYIIILQYQKKKKKKNTKRPSKTSKNVEQYRSSIGRGASVVFRTRSTRLEISLTIDGGFNREPDDGTAAFHSVLFQGTFRRYCVPRDRDVSPYDGAGQFISPNKGLRVPVKHGYYRIVLAKYIVYTRFTAHPSTTFNVNRASERSSSVKTYIRALW